MNPVTTPKRSNRVLAVRLDGLGDVLLTGPALRALAAGSRHVTLLAGPAGAPVAPLLPGVNDMLVYKAPWIGPNPQPLDDTPVRHRRLAGRHL